MDPLNELSPSSQAIRPLPGRDRPRFARKIQLERSKKRIFKFSFVRDPSFETKLKLQVERCRDRIATQSRAVKKEEGCGVWSARNLDRVSGNEPRILLQPGRAEGGRGGERRGGSKPFSLAKRRRGDEAKRGGGGQVLSVYGELISGVRNQSLPEAVTIATIVFRPPF